MHGFKPSSDNVFIRGRTCNICLFKFYDDTTFENHFTGWVHQMRLAIQQSRISAADNLAPTVGLVREVESAEQQAQTSEPILTERISSVSVPTTPPPVVTVRLPPFYLPLPGQAANTPASIVTAIIIPPTITTAAFEPQAVKLKSPLSAVTYHLPDSASLPKRENIRCNDCSKTFASAVALEQHRKSKQHISCDYCPKVFSNAAALKRHSKAMKHNFCDDCLRAFPSPEALGQHCQSKKHKRKLVSNAKISKGDPTMSTPTMSTPTPTTTIPTPTVSKPTIFVRPLALSTDLPAILSLDRSFTTTTIYNLVRTPLSLTLEEAAVNPPLAKTFPLTASELTDPNHDWEFGLVAEVSGSVVGFVAFTDARASWNRRTEICHLYVHPTARRQGVARALVEAVIEAVSQAGYARCVWLETSNVAVQAVRFYRSAGFELCGVDAEMYDSEGKAGGEFALFFAKPLTPRSGKQ